jgi:hypothetical protein
VIHDCIIVQPLTEMSIDLNDEFTESDVTIDDSDADGLEEQMEGLEVGW